MDPLTASLITTALGSLIGLAINGIKWLVNLKPEAIKKLKAVYLEVKTNKALLEKTVGKDGKGVALGTKKFKALAAGLSNEATKPLFKEYKTIRRGKIAAKDKQREQINRIQYAVNYIVCQIDELKAFAKQKTTSKVLLSVRLRTLVKHLGELEKVLEKL